MDIRTSRPTWHDLHELRLSALELHGHVLLSLGRHVDLVPDANRAVADHPLHEPLHAQLALALYRCGRQAEALRAITDRSSPARRAGRRRSERRAALAGATDPHPRAGAGLDTARRAVLDEPRSRRQHRSDRPAAAARSPPPTPPAARRAPGGGDRRGGARRVRAGRLREDRGAGGMDHPTHRCRRMGHARRRQQRPHRVLDRRRWRAGAARPRRAPRRPVSDQCPAAHHVARRGGRAAGRHRARRLPPRDEPGHPHRRRRAGCAATLASPW